jgi:hypothetical protein
MKSDQSGEVRPAVLNCDTALGQALIAMFVSLERELMAENALPGALKVIVFGGCAVHLYTSHRVSMDIDAEFFSVDLPSTINLRAMLMVAPQKKFIDASSGRLIELSFDLKFSTGLGPLHEDYLERGIPLEGFSPGSPLQLLIAALVDLAISKLGRASDQDIGDIFALLRSGFILASEFERLALQAIDCYVGNHEPPTSILRNILQDYLEISDGEPS